MGFKVTHRPLRQVRSDRQSGQTGSPSPRRASPMSPPVTPLLSRLGRDLFEQLESRVHLSVSRDVNGYTVVTPSSDSIVVYVSKSGNDVNDGSLNSPVASISRALQIVHPQSPNGAG